MLSTLAFRNLLVKRGRSLFLLLGYGLGVGVMIVLLSVGEAMLNQARDVSLVGGGEITVLPEGIDVEALRTGGVSALFFTIDRARFVARQGLGGPRHAGLVTAVAPAIEQKLVYLRTGSETIAVRAGGEIPSRSTELGSGIRVLTGTWSDSPADSAYIRPSAQQLYDEIDHFHIPQVEDSTWGEWHYFNIVTGPDEWWYVSLLVGGRLPSGRWGGQVLVTHRREDGIYERFAGAEPSNRIAFDTSRADLVLGASGVTQREGVYRIRVEIPDLTMNLTVQPTRYNYFPPVQLKEGEYQSGYAVAALRGIASGRVCPRGMCREIAKAPAYHDHNWGVWRDVSWEWGAASGPGLSFLYGQVKAPDSTGSLEPFFFSIVDSLGIRQVLRARAISYHGEQPVANGGKILAPRNFDFVAARDRDTIRVSVEVREAVATLMSTGSFQRYFLQMRGQFTLRGALDGKPVVETGNGFFETWR
ncbi:MAG: hypothetical protein ABI679_06145 [Gemmatimonadota bacterium]